MISDQRWSGLSHGHRAQELGPVPDPRTKKSRPRVILATGLVNDLGLGLSDPHLPPCGRRSSLAAVPDRAGGPGRQRGLFGVCAPGVCALASRASASRATHATIIEADGTVVTERLLPRALPRPDPGPNLDLRPDRGLNEWMDGWRGWESNPRHHDFQSCSGAGSKPAPLGRENRTAMRNAGLPPRRIVDGLESLDASGSGRIPVGLGYEGSSRSPIKGIDFPAPRNDGAPGGSPPKRESLTWGIRGTNLARLLLFPYGCAARSRLWTAASR